MVRTRPSHFTRTANRFVSLYPFGPNSEDNHKDHFYNPIAEDPSDEPFAPSDASDDELERIEAPILAEFEESQRHSFAIQDFATELFTAKLIPGFKHPLQLALHLMKLGLDTHRNNEARSLDPSCSYEPTHADCGMQTTHPPTIRLTSYKFHMARAGPMPLDTLYDPNTYAIVKRSELQAVREQLAPSPPSPVRVLVDASTQANQAPPPPPARVLVDSESQTASPAPPPSSPARTPTRSPSPTPSSSSTRATFDRVLTNLTALRKEVSPPPSPPPTPRTGSPAPCTGEPSSITVAVPHGTSSLTCSYDPIYAWRFKIATTASTAKVQRSRSPRGRPRESPLCPVPPSSSGHLGTARQVSASVSVSSLFS